MNHGNAALDLTDDLDYLFADDFPEQEYMDDHWIELARRHRQRALAARREALNFDDEQQQEINQQLDAGEELEILEDDDLLDMSLVIDDDDVLDLISLPDRPLY